MATNREHKMPETPKAVNARVMGRQFFTASVTSKTDCNHISLKELTKLSDVSMSAARRSARARDRKTADNISSNSVLQTEGQSKRIQMLEETVQKLVDIQDQLMQHVSTVASTGEEMKREDKVEESKYSMSSKFYKEGWKSTERLKTNENFKDWLDRLELEVSLVRPKGLYWKQLSGELSYDDMSTEQREMFYERSGDLLLSIKSCLAGTKYINLIRHVKGWITQTGGKNKRWIKYLLWHLVSIFIFSLFIPMAHDRRCWLFAERFWLLWSPDTQREVCTTTLFLGLNRWNNQVG